MKTKRFLILGKYYPPVSGGIEYYTKIVSEMLAHYFKVTVLCFSKTKDYSNIIKNGVSVKSFPVLFVLKSQPVNLKILWQAFFEKADAIHFHAPNFILLFSLFLRVLSKKNFRFIITHHTDVYKNKAIRILLVPFYKYLCKRACAVIVSSRKFVALSQDLPKICNIKVIPLSINCNLYKNKNFKRFSSETIFVGFLGRHARYKGIDILLRACSRIQETHVNIAGDGPFRSQAEILTNELKMTSRVTFLGDITLFNQKLNFYNSIDIFVFPSTEITETFGIVQLEAMVMEIPVVSSNLPTGVTDVAIHGRTALLIRPGNINDLVRAIFRLKKDKRLRKRLIFQAKKHVTKNFNDHINMKKTLQVFQDCLSQV